MIRFTGYEVIGEKLRVSRLVILLVCLFAFKITYKVVE